MGYVGGRKRVWRHGGGEAGKNIHINQDLYGVSHRCPIHQTTGPMPARL